jgi:hypothetical protein
MPEGVVEVDLLAEPVDRGVAVLGDWAPEVCHIPELQTQVAVEAGDEDLVAGLEVLVL